MGADHPSVFIMEMQNSHRTRILSPAHLPTILLWIGYIAFWLELYVLRCPHGQTSWLAWISFSALAIKTFWEWRIPLRSGLESFKAWYNSINLGMKCWLLLFKVLVLLILFISFYAHVLPPHLVQETDVLNYHLTVPRQHLIQGSFAWLPWSTADLYLLPVDFALAPYQLSTFLPNKFPQFIIFLGLLGIVWNLTTLLTRGNFTAGFLAIAGVFGSHVVGIQLGTGMLDLTLAYLFLAAIVSFLTGSVTMAALELTFYLWAKSFHPLQIGLLAVFVPVIVWAIKKFRCGDMTLGFAGTTFTEYSSRWGNRLKQLVFALLSFSLFIGGPFVLKSIFYTGTPLFPFAVGMTEPLGLDTNSSAWDSLVVKAQQIRATRDQYGSGRSWRDFIEHFWWLAVPEQGVNNRYDYPVGLVYLLTLGPFGVYLVRSIWRRSAPILPILVVVFWAVWWLGSHQSRFLTIPLLLMMVLVFACQLKPSKVLLGCLLLSLALETVSVYRAHRDDFFKPISEVLRAKDRELLMLSHSQYGKVLVVDYPDAAFASVPIDVRGTNSVFVLNR